MTQKHLAAVVEHWDPQTRHLDVHYQKWWERNPAKVGAVTFTLDPTAIVSSDLWEPLHVTELHQGQPVTVQYVTGEHGVPIAKVIQVLHPPHETAKPSSPVQTCRC